MPVRTSHSARVGRSAPAPVKPGMHSHTPANPHSSVPGTPARARSVPEKLRPYAYQIGPRQYQRNYGPTRGVDKQEPTCRVAAARPVVAPVFCDRANLDPQQKLTRFPGRARTRRHRDTQPTEELPFPSHAAASARVCSRERKCRSTTIRRSTAKPSRWVSRGATEQCQRESTFRKSETLPDASKWSSW
eukprot:3940643-Rhodomonas_salina.3